MKTKDFRNLPTRDITIKRNTVVLAIDEFGDEKFKDKDNIYFGFGGFFIQGVNCPKILDRWSEIKKEIYPDLDRTMHATEDKLNSSQIKKITAILKSPRIHPFTVAVMKPPVKIPECDGLDYILRFGMKMIFEEIDEVFENIAQIENVFIMSEHSERLTDRIHQTISGITLTTISGDIPVEHSIAEKRDASPFLEIADYLAWQAQGNLYKNNKNREKYFENVFHKRLGKKSIHKIIEIGSIRSGDTTVDFETDYYKKKFRMVIKKS